VPFLASAVIARRVQLPPTLWKGVIHPHRIVLLFILIFLPLKKEKKEEKWLLI